MTREDVRTSGNFERPLAAKAGGEARILEMGPLDFWNAHDNGNRPGWTAQARLVLCRRERMLTPLWRP